METQNEKKVLNIETEIDFNGFSDYWHGHGHAFEKSKLIQCIQWSMPINYTETIKEVIDGINESVNAYDWLNNVYDENLYNKHKKEIDALTSEDFEKSIRELIKPDTKDCNKFWDAHVEKFNPEDEFDESPVLIGWIHISEAD